MNLGTKCCDNPSIGFSLQQSAELTDAVILGDSLLAKLQLGTGHLYL